MMKKRIDVRVDGEQKERWEKAARKDPRCDVIQNDNLKLSAWIRTVLDAEADRVLGSE